MEWDGRAIYSAAWLLGRSIRLTRSIVRTVLESLMKNAQNFLARDFHMTAGMHHLIESFYRSIIQEAPVPIPYREILRTARIMNDIFAQLDEKRSPLHGRDQMSPTAALIK